MPFWFHIFFHSFTFVNSAFSASFNNSCIFQILLQYMSNYVNFKLLGKALEQTKSYKNQQIDRNFYSYLKKIGLPVFVLKTRCSMKKINSTSLLYCLHEASVVLAVRFRWSDFFATHSFSLLVQSLLRLIFAGKFLLVTSRLNFEDWMKRGQPHRNFSSESRLRFDLTL